MDDEEGAVTGSPLAVLWHELRVELTALRTGEPIGDEFDA
jgi:hypothetical protein